jgi:hypothetical protein
LTDWIVARRERGQAGGNALGFIARGDDDRHTRSRGAGWGADGGPAGHSNQPNDCGQEDQKNADPSYEHGSLLNVI